MTKRFFCKTAKGFISIEEKGLLSVTITNVTPGLEDGLEGKSIKRNLFHLHFEDIEKVLKFSEAFDYMKMGYVCRSERGVLLSLKQDNDGLVFIEHEPDTGRPILLKHLSDVPFLESWRIVEGS